MAQDIFQAKWKIKVHLLVTAGGVHPREALKSACDEFGIAFTAPMEKYPHSYTHSSRKWMQEQIEQMNGRIIRLICEMDNEFKAVMLKKFPELDFSGGHTS